MCRDCQRNLNLGCKGPNLFLIFRARLSTTQTFGISADSPQRCSPFWSLNCFFITMPSSWESWRTHKQQKYGDVREKKHIYPTAAQTIIFKVHWFTQTAEMCTTVTPTKKLWTRICSWGQQLADTPMTPSNIPTLILHHSHLFIGHC